MQEETTQEEGKNKGGRPTKLTDEMVDSAYKYLDEVQEQLVTKKRGYDKDGETRWEETAPMLPNHARLAFRLGVNKTSIYEWQKPHEEDDEEMSKRRKMFSDCLSRLSDLQEAMLNENGAGGVFNPAVTNRILAAQHGYKERTDKTSDDKPTGNTHVTVTDERTKKAVEAFEEAMRPKRQ